MASPLNFRPVQATENDVITYVDGMPFTRAMLEAFYSYKAEKCRRAWSKDEILALLD